MEYIVVEKKDRTMWIGLNRPDMQNAANTAMLAELSDALTELENDPELWCGIIYTKIKHFTVGLELNEVSERLQKDRAYIIPEGNVDPFGLTGPIRTKPLIVAAQGFCYTLGIELMLNTEYNIAAPKTIFRQMEVGRGIFPIGGGTMRWVERAGYGRAMRYLLTGDAFKADKALELGIIQEIVEQDKLLEKAEEWANRFNKQAPLAVQTTIKSAQTHLRHGFYAAQKELIPQVLDLMATEDAKEGVDSFMEEQARRL